MNLSRTNSANPSETTQQPMKDIPILSKRCKDILPAVPNIIMQVDANKIYTWANPAGLDFWLRMLSTNKPPFISPGSRTLETTKGLLPRKS